MGDRTGIEWTDATWNPVTGCTKVSPGCDHCYAESIAHRFAGTPAYPNGFDITLRPERLTQPLRWTRPRRVFVNSMSDLFHKDVPEDFIDSVFGVMAANVAHTRPTHTFQLLTKRHGRLRSYLSAPDVRQRIALAAAQRTDEDHADRVHEFVLYGARMWPLPNVWVGVSVEDQARADLRIPALLQTPAAVRFLSCEPLLAPVDLSRHLDPERDCRCGVPAMEGAGQHAASCGCLTQPEIGWVIVGGESGPGARPMQPEWARQLRDQCTAAGVPFHFKQWGEWAPAPDVLQRVGKKAAGRLLDGRTWNEEPVR